MYVHYKHNVIRIYHLIYKYLVVLFVRRSGYVGIQASVHPENRFLFRVAVH